MIYLGHAVAEKQRLIADYVRKHNIQKVFVISAAAFPVREHWELIAFEDVIKYVVFYRLLQEIHADTLVVIDECLRSQNRYDLAYNCIRNYLNQTSHQLIFQFFPQIDTREDYMILFDFDTRSRFKREAYSLRRVRQALPQVQTHPITFEAVEVITSLKTKLTYVQERERLFAELGARDPHTLPRNLYLVGGADKLQFINATPAMRYVARNKRLKSRHGNLSTYAAPLPSPVTLVELPHRFIDFANFVFITGQTHFPVLVADLKVDRWYYQRYQEWGERLNATYADLHG